jgi:hypothetical protein
MSYKIKRCELNLSDSEQVQSSYVWSTVVTLLLPHAQDLLQQLFEYQLLKKLISQTCQEF